MRAWALVAFAAFLALFEGPAEIACAVAAALVLPRVSLRRLWVPLLGITIWAGAGYAGTFRALAADLPIRSEDALRPLLALAFLVGAAGIAPAEPRELRRLAWAFGACIVLNGAYGWLQLVAGALPLDGLLLKNVASQQIWVPDREYEVRSASGLFYNRLKLSHVGAGGLALLGSVAIGTAGLIPRRTRALAALGLVVLGGAVLLTYARTAPAGLMAALLLLTFILNRFSVALGALAIAVMGGLATLATPSGLERWLKVARDLDIRLHLYRTALRVLEDHPLLGVGHGAYRALLAPIWDGRGSNVDTHSLPIQVLVETGAVGLAGWALAVGWSSLVIARRVFRERDETSMQAILHRAAFLTLFALLAIGLFHVVTHHAPVALLLWAALGIAAAGVESPHTQSLTSEVVRVSDGAGRGNGPADR